MAERTFLLLPGWACDGRAFLDLPARLPGRVLVPDGFAGHALVERAAALLAAAPGRATVIGWSLGARLALRLARARPEAIERVVLVGLRPAFPPAVLAAFREGLARDRAASLSAFYRECFLPSHREAFRRFRDEVLPAYLRDADEAALAASLALLAPTIGPADLEGLPVTLLHGARDPVAPAAELLATGREVRLLPAAGHAAFCDPAFPSHV